MKAILALALLCIAAQAAHLNISAYHLGFAENLGLNETQIQHGFNCFKSIKNVMHAARDVAHHSESSRLILNILNLAEEAREDLKATCKVYAHDIVKTVFQRINGTDLKLTIGSNFNKYPLEIIQQVALWVNAIESGDMYHAGNIEASIIQILLGLQTPYRLPTPTLNETRFVALNETKYVHEALASYFETLGIRNEDMIKANIECQLSVLAFAKNAQEFNSRLYAAKSNVEKFHTILKFVDLGSIATQQCRESLKLNWSVFYAPLIDVFRAAPGHSALHIIKNIALNLPEIANLKMQSVVDLLEGRYPAVGDAEARIYLDMVQGLF